MTKLIRRFTKDMDGTPVELVRTVKVIGGSEYGVYTIAPISSDLLPEVESFLLDVSIRPEWLVIPNPLLNKSVSAVSFMRGDGSVAFSKMTINNEFCIAKGGDEKRYHLDYDVATKKATFTDPLDNHVYSLKEVMQRN